MANLYYCEKLDVRAFQLGTTIAIEGDEARHAVRVARLRVGERTLIGNGQGVLGGGEVIAVGREDFSILLDEIIVSEAPETELVLVQALAKGDRDERAVEQATEFGVDRILPWQATRSVSRWDGHGSADKQAKGRLKWSRIAREAAKQSMRAHIPPVGEPVSLAELCQAATADDTDVLVMHPRGGSRLSEWATQNARGSSRMMLVVGPEGGFDEAELDALETAGAHVLMLGETVLRTSSAGPAALAVLNAALGRW